MAKQDTFKAVLSEGLKSANRGNPFWTQADAMQSFSLYHKLTK